jgi:uncharacterized protein YfkK (UPF0435 family)
MISLGLYLEKLGEDEETKNMPQANSAAELKMMNNAIVKFYSAIASQQMDHQDFFRLLDKKNSLSISKQ